MCPYPRHLAKRHPDFAAVGVCNWLDLPTAARAARAALGQIFRAGYRYQRAGVG